MPKENTAGTIRFLRRILLTITDWQAAKEIRTIIRKLESKEMVAVQRTDLCRGPVWAYLTDLEDQNWRLHIKNYNAEQSAAGWRFNFMLALAVLIPLVIAFTF